MQVKIPNGLVMCAQHEGGHYETRDGQTNAFDCSMTVWTTAKFSSLCSFTRALLYYYYSDMTNERLETEKCQVSLYPYKQQPFINKSTITDLVSRPHLRPRLTANLKRKI